MSELILKPMETPEEIRGKAYVHWKSWQESYAGIVDAGYLQRLTLEKCEEMAFRWPKGTWVAKLDGRVVGFAAWGPAGDAIGAGELYALYVLRDFQGRQIGRRLMALCLEDLRRCRQIFLWVFRENEQAIRFYERSGFRPDGAERVLDLGAPATAIRMVREEEPEEETAP